MNDVILTKAELVDATTNLAGIGASGTVENTGPLPAHCVVSGEADARTGADGNPYTIHFEVRMPTSDWNGRFFFQGGGGVNGFLATAYGNLRGNIIDASGIPTDNALSRGFAVASTDGGHSAATGTAAQNQVLFGMDPQARLDYGYNAVARTTSIAKALVAKHYGTTANRSYFVGCSNGGRDAMVASQRLPDEFDGVFALNPGFQLPKAAVNQAWDTQLFYSLNPNIYESFTKADLEYVASQILAQCDSLDGATDGLILNQTACAATFDPNSHLPSLSASKKETLIKVFGGAKSYLGDSLYADFPWDAGVSYRDWRNWKIGRADVAVSGAANGASSAISIGAHSLPSVFMSPGSIITGDEVITGSTNALAFMNSVKTQVIPGGTVDPDLIYATSGIFTTQSMSKTERGVGFMSGNGINYDVFRTRGSKLIVAHGTSDPVFSSNDTRNWYTALDAAYAGKAADFARYFPIPGMNHCSGGPATDRFDMLKALVDWVENGVVPASVSASSRDQNYQYTGPWESYRPTSLIAAGITRPLCAYPTQAKSTDGGATWTCQ
jgi:feruloyl esterase